MKNILFVSCALLLFSSCEKIVDLDYQNNQSLIVIEGNITDQPGPYFVKIRKSTSLTDISGYPTIDNAVVVISDDTGSSETLTPQGQGLYSTRELTGTEGRTYTLTVQAENKSYVARSTMPMRVPFEGIKVEQVAFGGDTEFNLIPEYDDPAAKGNQYRFELSVNGKVLNQHFIQNDEVRNGVRNTVRLEMNDDASKLVAGDLIAIKMQCIDASVALYYRTLALISDSGPGGGITPNNPPTNIDGGALGLFSANTVETIVVTIP